MRKLVLAIAMMVIPTVVLATATARAPESKEKKETLKEKKERLDDICEQLIEQGTPKPTAQGLHVRMGKAAEWVINNTNKPDGWSFTGYADLKMDKKGNMSRWKFGIINGEMDWAVYEDLDSRSIPNYQLLEEWNQRKNNNIIIGIFFCKEF